MKCRVNGCINTVFAQYDKCALHCEKNKYSDDRYKGVLEEFYNLLKDYISQTIQTVKSDKAKNNKANVQKVPLKAWISDIPRVFEEKNELDSATVNLIKENNPYDEITLKGISFPSRNSRDHFDYFKILRLFRGIHLVDCEFYIYSWVFRDVEFFFQNCIFHDSFDITPLSILDNDTGSIFSECIFKSKVLVSADDETKTFESSIFSGGDFNELVTIKDATFNSIPFSDTENNFIKLSTLEIFSCNFIEGINLNNTKVCYLKIKDTEFLSNFLISKAEIGTFNCINSKIEGLFDASETHFIRVNFNRTKFEDVADFEKAVFGESCKRYEYAKEYITKFTFVTFMTASNFKNTKFYYSLDFENVDLREQPNFLKSNINPRMTNRETFRIIKNSFDSRGNTLEGNRFFVQEMKAFKIELKEEGSIWDKLVYNLNDLLSEFGSNYVRPVIILLASIMLYTLIDYLHEDYFATYDYFISAYLEPVWLFLNDLAKNFLPFSKFLANKSGLEFISLLFYIWFAILIWQIIVSIKRQTQR